MDCKISVLVISIFIYLRINSVSCLKCHVCSTHTPGQSDCERIADSAHNKYLTECAGPLNATSCRIQEQWVEFETLGQTHEKRTIRQCASTPYDPVRPCYYRTGFGGKVNVCNCLGDGCNGAKKTTASMLFVTLGLLFISKFLIKNTGL